MCGSMRTVSGEQRQIFMKQDAVRDIEGNYEEVIAKEIFIMARYDARKLRNGMKYEISNEYLKVKADTEGGYFVVRDR